MPPYDFKKYFITTISERRGTIILLVLLFALVSFYLVDDWVYDVEPVEIKVEELAQVKEIQKIEHNYKAELEHKKNTLFQFNPNVIDKEDWEKLGFTSKQANSIINFRAAGFKFKKKEDLKKLFVVDDLKYKQLAPYIVIPSKKEKQANRNCYRVFISGGTKPIYKGFENIGQVFYRKKDNEYQYYSNSYSTWELAENQLKVIENSSFTGAYIAKLTCDLKLYPIKIKVDTAVTVFKEKIKRQIVNLNSADTTMLKTLSGIGSYYASKIIAYRTKLGGFYNQAQLLDIYGVKQEVLNANVGFITVDSALVQKININTASKETLKTHPYIKWNVANSIVLYRANHGKYKKVEDVKNSLLIDDDLYHKIKGYLTVK